jgi:hypothetical protein
MKVGDKIKMPDWPDFYKVEAINSDINQLVIKYNNRDFFYKIDESWEIKGPKMRRLRPVEENL